MVRLLLSQQANYEVNSMPLAIGLFISISALVALCAKHGHKNVKQKHNQTDHDQAITNSKQVAPNKSPLASPRKFVINISNRAIPLVTSTKRYTDGDRGDDHDLDVESGGGNVKDGGFGEGGLWQKSIIMGERCRPPEFPGVIYYDSNGNQVSEMPRSPRATSPLHSFSFPVVLKHSN